MNLQANIHVDRSGEIYLPQVGPVHVHGLAFSTLDAHLREAVGRVYRNFDLTADLGQIRAIQIYVSGQARQRGVYTVSSLSTLVDALFASGRPSVEGSLRSIELRRNGAVVTRFDLYDLLIRGDKSKDAKLLPGDVIFIPPVGPQAAVFGSVHNPAIYELLPQESLGAVLADAGAVSTVAAEARLDRAHRRTPRPACHGGGLRSARHGGISQRRRRDSRVLPAVRARCPQAQFKITGRIGAGLKRRLSRETGLIVTGGVVNIIEAARHASAGVCPIRFGAGVPNKMLEYFSLGIPAVTSSIGFEGLDAVPGVHAMVADTPEQWADAICGLLESPESGRMLAVAGRALVEERRS